MPIDGSCHTSMTSFKCIQTPFNKTDVYPMMGPVKEGNMSKPYAVLSCCDFVGGHKTGKAAKRAGSTAYNEGMEIRNNPHTRNSNEWEQWRLGYLSQMARVNKEKG
jgi:hypothetical protein